MLRVTIFSGSDFGGPESSSGFRDIASSFSSLKALLGGTEIFREMVECAHHWIWGEPTQSAKGPPLHRVAKVLEHGEITLTLLAGHDLVHQLHAARGADAAGRALAAGFDGAELHGEPRLQRHVHRVVEHHHAAMADQTAGGGKRFIVERRVELLAREIGAERAAHLDRAHRPARIGAAADLVHELAERDAEGGLVQPAMLDVAGKLNGHGAARLAHAEIAVVLAAVGHDDRHGGEYYRDFGMGKSRGTMP